MQIVVCRRYRQLEDPCFVKFSADDTVPSMRKLTPMPVYRNEDRPDQAKAKAALGTSRLFDGAARAL